MSGAKTAARRASKKHIEPKIEARLADFDDYKDELLNSLHEAYRRGPKTKPFDEDRAWQNLKFVAFVYFQREREVTKKQSMAPAGDRVELLTRLGMALRDARSAANEVMKTAKGQWFLEWAIANGNPDFTDPRIEDYQHEFETRVSRLRGLEEAAFQAAKTARRKRGRPSGTTVVSHEFILHLESVYRNIACRNAGAGYGPFFRFVTEFLTALGYEYSDETVIEAIKGARKQEEKHPQPMGTRFI